MPANGATMSTLLPGHASRASMLAMHPFLCSRSRTKEEEEEEELRKTKKKKKKKKKKN